MNMEADKIALAKKILDTTNPEIILAIKDEFNRTERDFWDDLSSQQQEEIKRAFLEVKEGKFVDYKTFIAKHL